MLRELGGCDGTIVSSVFPGDMTLSLSFRLYLVYYYARYNQSGIECQAYKYSPTTIYSKTDEPSIIKQSVTPGSRLVPRPGQRLVPRLGQRLVPRH